jgi:hypothetical protein
MLRFILLFLFISNSVLAQKSPLTILVFHYPPFFNMNSPSEGMAWNLLHDFATSKGVEIKAHYLPAARLLTQVEKGNWQATIATLSQNFDDHVGVEYSTNTIDYGLQVKHRKPLVIEGLRVSAIRAAGFSAAQNSLAEQGTIISEVNTIQQAYLMYEAGHVDAVLGAAMHGKSMGMPNLEEYVMAVKLVEIPFVLSLNIHNPAALAAYKKLIAP